LEHDGTRCDPGAMADLDVSEDLGAGAYQHSLANLRMPVARLLAGAPKRHAVQHRDIVLDHRSLADYEAGSMINEDAAPNPRIRMNVALKHSRRTALQIQSKILPVLSP